MPYDRQHMLRAIELAQRGEGFVNPNPLVGCVLVRDGQVIGEGWHARYGAAHAERDAIMKCLAAGVSCRGAEAYVTLEPCCHHGKQPPCSDLLIEQGISRVYVGIADPNPKVAGHGIEQLRNAGIEVEVGFEEEAIREQNKAFLKLFTSRMPFVLMKSAVTLDGKIATATGDARWVSSVESRALVHRLRHQMMAICVGINTVLVDDPMLNCRMSLPEVAQPLRVVVDSTARIPLRSRLVTSARQYPLLVAHTDQAPYDKIEELRRLGVVTLGCGSVNGHVDIADMLRRLVNPTNDRYLPVDSLLLEGGASLNAAFLKARCVDEVIFFVAPKLVGGPTAPSPVAELGISAMADALQLHNVKFTPVGSDLCVSGRLAVSDPNTNR